MESLPESADATLIEDNSASGGRVPTVRLQCEDFGGNFVLPYFGKTRPGRDYYVSNLTIHNFIISDLQTGQNRVFLYDERAMGKGCDALCSLRWMYHLQLHIKAREAGQLSELPDTLYLIMDNCVGQNKSQVHNIAYRTFLNSFHFLLSIISNVGGSHVHGIFVHDIV